jgi:hypothetical protein
MPVLAVTATSSTTASSTPSPPASHGLGVRTPAGETAMPAELHLQVGLGGSMSQV